MYVVCSRFEPTKLKLSAAVMQPTGPTTVIVVKTDIAGATAAINELFELISILLP